MLRRCLILSGLILAAWAVETALCRAAELPRWDFVEARSALWHGEADVDRVMRTAAGMTIVPSGTIPIVLSEAIAFRAADAAYVRIRAHSLAALSGARLGWMRDISGGAEQSFNMEFSIPRGIRGGFATIVWIRVENSPDWAGSIHRLGLAIPSRPGEAITIESLEVLPDTWFTRVQLEWSNLQIDAVAERKAMPMWSYNSVGTMRLSRGTLNGVMGWVAIVALAVLAVSRRIPNRGGVRCLGRVAAGVLISLVMGLTVLALYVDVLAWRIEHAVFGGRPSGEAYRYLDGISLATIGEDLRRRTLPSPIMLCIGGGERYRELIFNRARYQFYPVRVEPTAPHLLTFTEASEGCSLTSDPLIRHPLYIVSPH